MTTKIKRNYYKFTVNDCGDIPPEAFNDCIDSMLDCAIELARERERTYHIPCEWRAKYNENDSTITVCKLHY
jgi:hypothetical protein